jgi:hypothetical protein
MTEIYLKMKTCILHKIQSLVMDIRGSILKDVSAIKELFTRMSHQFQHKFV